MTTAFTTNLHELRAVANGIDVKFKNGKTLDQRLTGKFYTPGAIGQRLAADISLEAIAQRDSLSIIDPFCGDGRLIYWFISHIANHESLTQIKKINVSLWDCDAEAVEEARRKISAIKLPYPLLVDARVTDSFFESTKAFGEYDICLTNPPWETLKPDSRELANLDDDQRERYTQLLKNKSFLLDGMFPQSRSLKKFSGWGTNLARCGIEAAVKLLKPGGLYGIVAPSTIFGDQSSVRLRTWLFEQNAISRLRYYPAEARLFEKVDQGVTCLMGIADGKSNAVIPAEIHSSTVDEESTRTSLRLDDLAAHDYSIGFSSDQRIVEIMERLSHLPTLAEFEGSGKDQIKLGRELDETGLAAKLADSGKYIFLKGKYVSRYKTLPHDETWVSDSVAVPKSADTHRIAWRDVSRQSMAHRVQATLIEPGVVTGNSLNIGYFNSGENTEALQALLAIFNSSIFEIQARLRISTNHLSVGAVRKFRIPNINDSAIVSELAEHARLYRKNSTVDNLFDLDKAIARHFDLNIRDLTVIYEFLRKNDSVADSLYVSLKRENVE